MKLSQLVIKNAKSKEKPYKLSDGAGMYLLVNPSGSKYWRLKYSYAGREKLLALGVYPTVSLQEARHKRDEAKSMLKQGIDPAGGDNSSFENLTKEWLRINRRKWTSDHAATIERRLETHLIPFLSGNIVDITPKMILSAIRRIEKAGKTETAHKVLGHAVGIFQLAVIEGVIKYNPARDLSGGLMPHIVTPMRTITVKEIPDLLKAINAAKNSEVVKLATLIKLHTFPRSSELRGGKWAELSEDEAMWTIPGERMKVKNRGDHLVPLSRQVLGYFKRLYQINGDKPYMFASLNNIRQKHPIISENAINNFIDDIGFGERLVGHGFRALATTTLRENLGFPRDIIDRQLAHKEDNKVWAAYDRGRYLQQRRDMMQAWSDYIESFA